jgi:hypothetical protein
LSDRQQPGAFSASRSIPWIIAGKRRRAHRYRRVVRVQTAAGQPGAPAPLKQYIGADRLLSFHRSDSPNQIVLRSRGTREGADTEPTAMASARRVAVASPSPRREASAGDPNPRAESATKYPFFTRDPPLAAGGTVGAAPLYPSPPGPRADPSAAGHRPPHDGRASHGRRRGRGPGTDSDDDQRRPAETACLASPVDSSLSLGPGRLAYPARSSRSGFPLPAARRGERGASRLPEPGRVYK